MITDLKRLERAALQTVAFKYVAQDNVRLTPTWWKSNVTQSNFFFYFPSVPSGLKIHTTYSKKYPHCEEWPHFFFFFYTRACGDTFWHCICAIKKLIVAKIKTFDFWKQHLLESLQQGFGGSWLRQLELGSVILIGYYASFLIRY